MQNIFSRIFKKKKRIPKSIQVALDEYRKLCLYGCLKIPCHRCKYLRRINEHYSTCKREELMAILWDKYKDEIDEIDAELRGK